MLQKVLLDEIFARIQEAQVDSFAPAPETDFLPIINGAGGDEIGESAFQSFIEFAGAK